MVILRRLMGLNLEPQNDRQNLSFVKDEHAYGKKWPEKVVQRSFMKGHSFPIGL